MRRERGRRQKKLTDRVQGQTLAHIKARLRSSVMERTACSIAVRKHSAAHLGTRSFHGSTKTLAHELQQQQIQKRLIGEVLVQKVVQEVVRDSGERHELVSDDRDCVRDESE